MWLMTTRGFVSAVRWQKRGDPKDGMVVLRARDRKHLRDVVAVLPGKRPRVQETPGADYRYRAWVTPDQFAELAAALAREVDYPNFKSAVFDRGGRSRYEGALHQVWGVLSHLQPGGPYATRRWGKRRLRLDQVAGDERLEGLDDTDRCDDCGRVMPLAELDDLVGRLLCKDVGACLARCGQV